MHTFIAGLAMMTPIKNTLATLPRFLLLTAIAVLLAGCDFEVSPTDGGYVFSDIQSPVGISQCRRTSGTCVVRDYEDNGSLFAEVDVRLTAIADPGYRFSHWQGCDSSERLHCKIHLDGDIYIRAHFEPIQPAAASGNNQSLRFVALGDFGTGGDGQRAVADAIHSECEKRGGCDFAIGLGDNIYSDAAPKDVDDALFASRFEAPFSAIDFPFYLTLGNHDNDWLIDGLGSFNAAGEIQVNYSSNSDKWVMPDRYYMHEQPQQANQPLASFFALDSNPLMAPLEIVPEYWMLKHKIEMGDWIDQAIASARGTWKIAYAHHPYISNGIHGNAGNYEGLPPVWPLLSPSGEIYRKWLEKHVCGKVDVFFAGHDHEVQLLRSVPECGNTLLVVSGAAAKTREFADASRNPTWYQKDNTLGFVIGEISGDSLTMTPFQVQLPTVPGAPPTVSTPPAGQIPVFQRRQLD
ncbi:MAG: metallophosphoesterase [Alcanivoracaceae bacterium]|nr:metallophosphoesterase [Alcanivoracaceae bacterium]